jgi:hypothetical protein
MLTIPGWDQLVNMYGIYLFEFSFFYLEACLKKSIFIQLLEVCLFTQQNQHEISFLSRFEGCCTRVIDTHREGCLGDISFNLYPLMYIMCKAPNKGIVMWRVPLVKFKYCCKSLGSEIITSFRFACRDLV